MSINSKKYDDIIGQIKTIEKKLAKNNTIIDNLYKDKISNLLGESDFTRMYQEYSKESNLLNSKLEDLKNDLSKVEEDNRYNRYEECKGIIEEFLKLKKPTRNVIARLVNGVEVSESHELDVYFNFKEISIVNNI